LTLADAFVLNWNCMQKKSASAQSLLESGQALLNQGQALLIILLSMAVILVIVLSILSRSITDVTITSREEEALRAFSAAEAGIEQALVAGPMSGTFDAASFDAQVSQVAEGSNTFVSPLDVVAGDTATVWFVAHADDGSLECSAAKPCFTGGTMRICWGRPGTPTDGVTTPALEASILYAATPGDVGSIQVARATFDPNTSRRSNNSFAAPDAGGCTIESESYAFKKDLTLASLGIPAGVYGTQDGLQLARMRFLYNTDGAQTFGADVNFPGNGVLPSQGKRVESTGIAGEATRKVEVYDLFADLPAPFDSVLFTPGGITK